jgi:hypothetical protein
VHLLGEYRYCAFGFEERKSARLTSSELVSPWRRRIASRSDRVIPDRLRLCSYSSPSRMSTRTGGSTRRWTGPTNRNLVIRSCVAINVSKAAAPLSHGVSDAVETRPAMAPYPTEARVRHHSPSQDTATSAKTANPTAPLQPWGTTPAVGNTAHRRKSRDKHPEDPLVRRRRSGTRIRRKYRADLVTGSTSTPSPLPDKREPATSAHAWSDAENSYQFLRFLSV